VRRRGGIVIVIAHRPSALAAVDQVLVLANGQKVKMGPKEEVLRAVLRLARQSPPVRIMARRAPGRVQIHPPFAVGLAALVIVGGGLGAWAAFAKLLAPSLQRHPRRQSSVKKVHPRRRGRRLLVRRALASGTGEIVIKLRDQTRPTFSRRQRHRQLLARGPARRRAEWRHRVEFPEQLLSRAA
jgi:hypothetical protein